MQFGTFDDENREYVITDPRTPQPWSNYLGSKEYGAIITQNAGGYSFYRSGGKGRFMRMQFNSVLRDQPGRYVYLRDRKSNEYWSCSWQPVVKPLESFKTECRHGLGYTRIISDNDKIRSDIVYFVPLNKTHEIWRVRVTNSDTVTRQLSAFTYVEYANNWNAIDDLMNLQYSQYIVTMDVIDGIIDHGTNLNIPHQPENFDEKDQGRHTFQALAGLPVKSWETDREVFIGNYRTYANPMTVERGTGTNSTAYGDNACGCLHTDFDLEPGQTTEFLVIVGIGSAASEGKAALSKYADTARASQELDQLTAYWQDRIDGLTASTPDINFNRTVNVWGIYNSLITFTWSRAASLIYTGVDRDGLGFRDTVQDFLGVTHTIPQEVNDRLSLMLTGQVSTGGSLPVVYPTCHSPGNEPLPLKHDYRSDDALWLFNAIPAYIKETGHVDYLHTLLPYADQKEDTVFGHMKRAIQFSLARRGVHGLPLGLKADWNDCLRFGHTGESVFVAMQLRLAIATYIEIAQLLSEEKEKQWGEILLTEMDRLIQEHAWEGEWFLRGFGENDRKFGSKENHEGQIFLNPQVWAVMSGVATNSQAEQIMQHVYDRLFTPYGLMLCDPPFTSDDHNIVLAQLMNPGLKENAGIFMHTQSWAVIAEAMLGHGNRAYEYLKSYLPAAYNDRAEIREIEPYVLCQSAHSKYSPKQGTCRIPWLSGSATWTHYAMTQYILGIRPDYEGLVIDPCLPSHWNTLEVKRTFRGKTLNITIQNDSGKERGVSCMQVNGQEMTCNKIPVEMIECQNKVTVII